MPIRAKDADVKQILGDNYDGRSGLGQFILTANVLVNSAATCATERGVTVPTATWKIVESWVAAHLYCCMDALYMSRSNLRGSGSFQRTTGKGLDGTEYGQMAKRLDPSGCLADADSAQFASIAWLGLPPSEQTPYEDRD